MAKPIEYDGVEDIVRDSEIEAFPEEIRSFKYELNHKQAKAKLLKGAKREPFDIEKKSCSLNLIFNVGSWNNSVLPSIRYWNQLQHDRICRIGSSTVRVASVKTGLETGGKHVDTQIVFFIDRDKVTCHFYNTTLLILVNGHGYLRLVDEFLQPYFQSKIRRNIEEITQFNE